MNPPATDGGSDGGGATLKLENVHKRFGALEVLRGVDLAVPASTTIAIIGPSGSGKSTLVRCVNCLERIQGGVSAPA